MEHRDSYTLVYKHATGRKREKIMTDKTFLRGEARTGF